MEDRCIDQMISKFTKSQSKNCVKKSIIYNHVLHTPNRYLKNQKPKSQTNSSHKSYPRKQTFTTQFKKQFIEQSSNKNKLQYMVEYLSIKKNSRCRIKGHQNNIVKYLCLDKNCNNRIGCSYCCIQGHKNHFKIQIQQCLQDLRDLNQMMKISYNDVLVKKSIMRQQIISQLDKQIANLCDQFHHNLQFLKNKAMREIDEYLFQKYKAYQFMETLRQQQYDFTLRKQKVNQDQQLLKQILEIDILGIQRSLQSNIQKTQYQKSNLKLLTNYFEHMNGSMSYFMSEFKKSFPRLQISPHQIATKAQEQEHRKQESTNKSVFDSNFQYKT